MSRMYDLADMFVDEYVALDPLAATRLGIAGHDAEISDLSPDGAAASADGPGQRLLRHPGTRRVHDHRR